MAQPRGIAPIRWSYYDITRLKKNIIDKKGKRFEHVTQVIKTKNPD